MRYCRFMNDICIFDKGENCDECAWSIKPVKEEIDKCLVKVKEDKGKKEMDVIDEALKDLTGIAEEIKAGTKQESDFVDRFNQLEEVDKVILMSILIEGLRDMGHEDEAKQLEAKLIFKRRDGSTCS